MTDYVVKKLEDYVNIYNNQPNDVFEKSKHYQVCLSQCELIVIAILKDLGYEYDNDTEKYITQSETIEFVLEKGAENGKQKSATDLIEEVREEICDKYCKYSDRGLNDNEIEKLCGNCPLNKL